MTIDKYSENALRCLANGDDYNTWENVYQIYLKTQNAPWEFQDVENSANLGNALMVMLSYKQIEDISTNQMLASVSYYFLTKEINSNGDINSIKNRILLVNENRYSFQYTVSEVVEEQSFGFFSVNHSMECIQEMLISDLYANPILISHDDYFRQMKVHYDNMIKNNSFGKDLNTLMINGQKHHEKIFSFLHDKLITELDFNF